MASDLSNLFKHLLYATRLRIALKSWILSIYPCFILFIPLSLIFGGIALYLWILPLFYGIYQSIKANDRKIILQCDQRLLFAGQLEIAYESCFYPPISMINPIQALMIQNIKIHTYRELIKHYDLESTQQIWKLYHQICVVKPLFPNRWRLELLPILIILTFYQAFQSNQTAQSIEGNQIKNIASTKKNKTQEKKIKKLKAIDHKTADEQAKTKKTQVLTEEEFQKALGIPQKPNPQNPKNQSLPSSNSLPHQNPHSTPNDPSKKEINAGNQSEALMQKWQQHKIASINQKTKDHHQEIDLKNKDLADLSMQTSLSKIDQWEKKIAFYPFRQQKVMKKLLSIPNKSHEQ